MLSLFPCWPLIKVEIVWVMEKDFYDAFLRKCKKEVIKIGLTFFDPVEQIEGTRVEDIPLDYCVSPREIHFFLDSSYIEDFFY